jgi:hypothetical protein
MDFFEYAWATSFQITKRKHEEVKILVRDDIIFPVLGKDREGYVICLPEPKRKSKSTVEFQGLILNLNKEFHRKILWQLFRASIFHLSQHVAVSGFETYIDWAKNKNQNLALCVASMVEDAGVNAYARKVWPPFLPDIAFANTVAYMRQLPISLVREVSLSIMGAIISRFTIGKVKGALSAGMQTDVDSIVLLLQKAENLTADKIDEEADIKSSREAGLENAKLEIAEQVYEQLSKYGKPSAPVAMPHTENCTENLLYRKKLRTTEEEFNDILNLAFAKLDSKVFIDESSSREATQAFSTWEMRQKRKLKIIRNFADSMAQTRFSAIEFPKEDYTEYLRYRQLLSGPIRRIQHKLRLLKNIGGEDFKHESGLIDLQEAIQVVASQSNRSDIFVREELQSREEAWAIIIDASHSLSFFAGEVRGIALCLAETARTLILDKAAWGMFAFSDKFYIIKDFSENYSTRIRARIGGLKHGGLTYLRDGLEIAKSRLRQRNEQAKILIVVSDFFPSGEAQARLKLAEESKQIERAGFGLIGIGIRSNAVKNYCRINCTVDTYYDLMKRFSKAFIEYSSTV